MVKGVKTKRAKRVNLSDRSGIIDRLVFELSKHGSVRLSRVGLFKIVTQKGHKRYDFKKREVVDTPPYKQIIFTPAKGIRDMLKDGKMVSSD